MLRKGSASFEDSIEKSWGKESANESGKHHQADSFILGVSVFKHITYSEEFVNVFVRISIDSTIELVSFDKSQVVTFNGKFVCGFKNGDSKTESRSDNTVGSPHGFIIHGIKDLKGNEKVTEVIAAENWRLVSAVEVGCFFVRMELLCFIDEVFDSEYVQFSGKFVNAARMCGALLEMCGVLGEDGEWMWYSIIKRPYVRLMITDPDDPGNEIHEPLSKMTEANKKHYSVDIRVMNYLPQAKPNDIYNSVDACKDA
uniref:Uncharacterized protein n=1 Tax=Tanacetum cinerariifolium TaxID=118510 RepID=A0A6L2K7B7_TANCI|nr:hypothetical protein [Tanacetum cinerariifolium]